MTDEAATESTENGQLTAVIIGDVASDDPMERLDRYECSEVTVTGINGNLREVTLKGVEYIGQNALDAPRDMNFATDQPVFIR